MIDHHGVIDAVRPLTGAAPSIQRKIMRALQYQFLIPVGRRYGKGRTDPLDAAEALTLALALIFPAKDAGQLNHLVNLMSVLMLTPTDSTSTFADDLIFELYIGRQRPRVSIGFGYHREGSALWGEIDGRVYGNRPRLSVATVTTLDGDAITILAEIINRACRED